MAAEVAGSFPRQTPVGHPAEEEALESECLPAGALPQAARVWLPLLAVAGEVNPPEQPRGAEMPPPPPSVFLKQLQALSKNTIEEVAGR